MTFSAQNYSRPVIVYGWGVRLAKAEKEAAEFAERSGWPVCLTWGAADLQVPNIVGTFGTHGTRYANFAIQNADLVLSVGSRLDTKATGDLKSFAPKAEVVMVDVDAAEIGKFAKLGREVKGITRDARMFLRGEIAGEFPDVSPWRAQVEKWKASYPIVLPEYREEKGVNPYVFVERLSSALSADDVIVSDTGCSLAWMMQAFQFKGQRFLHPFNQTPMGCGLGTAIGAAFAAEKRVICITGDGGLSLGIAELATIAHHRLNVKIILFDNAGHAMCRQTQRQWLGGVYPATSVQGGLAQPDFVSIAEAYGLCSQEVAEAGKVDDALRKMTNHDRPSLMRLEISPEQGVAPQARFGAPLEDQDPALPREELCLITAA